MASFVRMSKRKDVLSSHHTTPSTAHTGCEGSQWALTVDLRETNKPILYYKNDSTRKKYTAKVGEEWGRDSVGQRSQGNVMSHNFFKQIVTLELFN